LNGIGNAIAHVRLLHVHGVAKRRSVSSLTVSINVFDIDKTSLPSCFGNLVATILLVDLLMIGCGFIDGGTLLSLFWKSDATIRRIVWA